MSLLILSVRYEPGGARTRYETLEAVKRISGPRAVLRGAGIERAAKYLEQTAPLRFEHEINRLRGFAWDLEDLA